MYQKLVLLFLVLLVGCRAGGPLGREVTSRAKDSQPPGWEEKKKAVPLVYDTVPFDASRKELRPAYDGHDIKMVYGSFERGPAAVTDVYAFRESLAPGPPGNDVSYDRERGNFRTRIRVEPCFDSAGNIDEARVAFVVAGYSEYGKSRRHKEVASEKEWLLWEVSAPADGRLREKMEIDGRGAYFVVEGRVSPQTDLSARDISVLLVCRPRSVKEGFSTATGTPPAIEGRAFMHYYLMSDFLELWVYDYKTGRILGKKKIA